ncbi:MAG: LysR family transcriptional regulator [Kiloniellales bacterium]|nr:LysR family transcriptional regulator [Kiloniellales bacterium]
MVTLRQLEALHWIARLGSFSRAADHLNASQSAISKRIQELEADCGFQVLHRAGREVRLTEPGDELLGLAREMLSLCEKISEMSGPASPITRRLRIGVNELTAATWLPALIGALEKDGRTIVGDVKVEGARALTDQLENGRLDLIVRSKFEHGPLIRSHDVAKVPLSWVASPSLCARGSNYSQPELEALPVVTYGLQAGVRDHVQPWAPLRKSSRRRVITTDSLGAIVGMTVAGLGVALLPSSICKPLITGGQLIELKTDNDPPELPFVIAYRTDAEDKFMLEAIGNIREVCDFSVAFPAPLPSSDTGQQRLP